MILQLLLRSEPFCEKFFNAIYIIWFVQTGALHVMHLWEDLGILSPMSHSIPQWMLWTIFTTITILSFYDHKIHKIVHIAGVTIITLFTVTTLYVNYHSDFSLFLNLEMVAKDLLVLSLTHNPIVRIHKLFKTAKIVGAYLLPIFLKLISVLPIIYIIIN